MAQLGKETGHGGRGRDSPLGKAVEPITQYAVVLALPSQYHYGVHFISTQMDVHGGLASIFSAVL